MKTLLFLLWVSAVAWGGARVEVSADCPQCALESCHWEIEISVKGPAENREIHLDWVKSVRSRHTEKPYAHPLECNVDRNFDEEGQGFLKVWYEGDKDPCVFTGVPGQCGVKFKSLPGAESPLGFVVANPLRQLARVEHLSTLDLQCGDLRKPREQWNQLKWRARFRWDRKSNELTAGTESLEKH